MRQCRHQTVLLCLREGHNLKHIYASTQRGNAGHAQTQAQPLRGDASQMHMGAGFTQLGGPSQLHLGGMTQDTLGCASQGLGMGPGFSSEAVPQYGGPLFQGLTQEVCVCT